MTRKKEKKKRKMISNGETYTCLRGRMTPAELTQRAGF